MPGYSDEKAASDGHFPILRARGRPRKHGVTATDSMFLKPSEYNTKAHWLARLARDRPDIHARVVGGEITAHHGRHGAGRLPQTGRAPQEAYLADADGSRRAKLDRLTREGPRAAGQRFTAASLDYLVGAGRKAGRHFEAKRIGRL
jgi:hypothetical protein